MPADLIFERPVTDPVTAHAFAEFSAQQFWESPQQAGIVEQRENAEIFNMKVV